MELNHVTCLLERFRVAAAVHLIRDAAIDVAQARGGDGGSMVWLAVSLGVGSDDSASEGLGEPGSLSTNGAAVS